MPARTGVQRGDELKTRWGLRRCETPPKRAASPAWLTGYRYDEVPDELSTPLRLWQGRRAKYHSSVARTVILVSFSSSPFKRQVFLKILGTHLVGEGRDGRVRGLGPLHSRSMTR